LVMASAGEFGFGSASILEKADLAMATGTMPLPVGRTVVAQSFSRYVGADFQRGIDCDSFNRVDVVPKTSNQLF
jgi:hypothetical protein